ncbi:DUF4253 domain-containing protein [Streptomyces sp. TRM43335]|uniref:DUF4253 domain-containing protein n=1 Tax=Streptomyces taklimakanensis TaxID=2569853 RepID=A0A6G2B930_9ACTN|nr:DUF4253 domain-containing protein [Streptomyces taklimakanensis]MTE18758.1 DUF4253 domain-containing protein [Streptomyces taklimakanensis]
MPDLRSLVASADLPPGTLIDRTVLGRVAEPLLWRADGPAEPAGWERLPAGPPGTGPHPVLLGRDSRGVAVEDDLLPGGADGRGRGRGDGSAAGGGAPDAFAVLAARWSQQAAREPDGGAVLRPYGRRWPGPARPAGRSAAEPRRPDAVAVSVARSLLTRGLLREPRLALVPVRHSSGIPAAIGWTGALAHEADTAPHHTVLRSWEERFGTRVVALEPDALHLSVPSPPRDVEEALPQAAEHYAFCPSVVRQGAGTLARYAEKWLVGRDLWSFWWD